MMRMTRRSFAAAALILALAQPALAGQPQFFRGAYRGVAINGYDPVAYFADGRAVEGSADITADWQGATWRFSSAQHRDAFLADPEKYAPQYGGYCAFAVARGYTAKTDPDAWSIVDGKLYLNYSQGVRATWSQDIPGNISSANANWPKVLE